MYRCENPFSYRQADPYILLYTGEAMCRIIPDWANFDAE